MMEGLEGLEYSNRGPISQTAEGSIQTSPDVSPSVATPLPPGQPPSHEGERQDSRRDQPADTTKGSLVEELARNFGKAIGEPGSQDQHPSAAPESTQRVDRVDAVSPVTPEPPKEKTWRDVEPPASTTKKVQEDWRQFKEKAKAEVDAKDLEIRRLSSELETTKGQAPQVQQLQEQLRQAQAIVERIAIERSPLFKQKVLDQEDLLRSRLGKTIDGTGLTPLEADAILRGDLNTRERVLESRQMSAFRRQQISDILSQWDRVAEDRDRMTSRGKETLSEFLRESQAAQEAQRARYIRESEQAFNDQMTLVTQKIDVYNRIEGNDAWNQTVDQLKTTARKLYDGNVPREVVAQAAILAPAAVALQNLLRSAYTEINQLRTQVQKLQGVQPVVRDTGGDITQPARALSSPNGDFVKDIVSKFQQQTGLP